MSASTGIITTLLSQVDHIIQTFTFNGYSALVENLRLQIHLAVVIYIALLGWSILNGWIEMSVSHLTKHVLKIAIACSLATQWSFFSLFVYNVLTNGPNELSQILCQSLAKTSSLTTASVNDTLQTVFDQGMALGVTTWNSGGLNSVSFYLYAVLIWLGILAVVGVALLEFVVAKFGLALLLVLAPVTCLLILWEGTKGMFESWLRQLLSFALVPLFVTASLMLLLTLLQTALNTMQTAITHGDYTLVHIAPFLLSAIVGIGLLLKAASIASVIGGGLVVNVMHVAQAFVQRAGHYSGYNTVRDFAKQKTTQLGQRIVTTKQR